MVYEKEKREHNHALFYRVFKKSEYLNLKAVLQKCGAEHKQHVCAIKIDGAVVYEHLEYSATKGAGINYGYL